MKRWGLIGAFIIVLSGCSQTNGRYSIAQDHAPDRTPTAAEIIDPVPRFEPYSRQGNAPYSLFGENYQIIDDVQNYEEVGIASWYGRKFHGHLTSNGEYFNMFSMTAAHKTLPLPSYVRVINLDNGREAVVRVNDRGPFHPGRIIDLSYAAAFRLGVTDTGTANVKIEVLQPELKTETNELGLFVQIAATQSLESAQAAAQSVREKYALPATIREDEGLHKLLTGPFSELEAARWLTQLRAEGFAGAFRVELPLVNVSQSSDESRDESSEVPE
ncbi:MAG: lytic transglycosylase RlpA [Idiomarinaceae bacterium HL-53]|nr:MAG: lytic transglycosylase RlpA [Idiomarinaceae bacterium HL-53]CUS48752.1 rare lipoprotein A [Idiomarinaceae bacterium HL-53]